MAQPLRKKRYHRSVTPILGQALDPWNGGNVVVIEDDDSILGRADDVSGLEEWIDVAARAYAERRLVRNTPDAIFQGVDGDLWNWATSMGADKFIVRVRDNRSQRMYLVKAFVKSRRSAMGSGVDTLGWTLDRVTRVEK